MGVPTRLPAGLSTAARYSTLHNCPEPDPTKLHSYFEDFHYYVAADWTVTTIGSGTVALQDGSFGELLLTNSAADNDGIQLQKKGESFLLTAGKKAWFKARFKVSDATQSDFIIGLAVTDTTLLGAVDGDGVTDGIYFAKEDGDTQLDVGIQKNTTTGQNRATNIATVADDTYLSVGLEYDGVSTLTYFVNDTKISTLDASSTYLPDTELTVSFGFLNGEAVAKTLTVDYIYAAIER